MSQDNPSFSPFRQYLWPIKSYELKKFIPLFCIAFFISFNYNILRIMKDTLLITAEYSGAEVLPFIKVWGIVPAAILITTLYSRLNNAFDRNIVFYTMVTIFVTFFALFMFVVYPMRDILHPHHFANWLTEVLPPGFKGLVAMIRYWTFSSFYIMSELWSSTILSMLFWGFANHITQMHEAKRFYGLISTGLNTATVIAGQVSVFICSASCARFFSLSSNKWENSLILLTSLVLISGILIMIIYAHLNERILKAPSTAEMKKKPKIKMSMRQNFSFLRKSKYLLYIALIVLAYNIIINLIEVIWKDQVRQLYPDPNLYNIYMSQITSVTGVLACITSFLISAQLIRKCGWTFTALLAPIALLVTSIGFFIFFFGKGSLVGVLATFGTSPLMLTVFFGAIQNCISRAAKFTLFDSTKEMAFIPLNDESKLRGKAVIDGVGSRLGKSGGSLIHQGLLIIFSSIAASAHIVAGVLFIIILGWIYSVVCLGKQFNALTKTKETETPAVKEEELTPAMR